MTVTELIAKLQRYPGDTLVMLGDRHDVALKAENVEDMPLRKLEYEGRVWGECCDDHYKDRGQKVHASKSPETGMLIS